MDWTPSTKTQNIDVLIIGAGPVGLSAAFWYLREGYSVVLLEKYAKPENALGKPNLKCFNERHQQVGLDPGSLEFLHQLSPNISTAIRKAGCPDQDWINISIYQLQNILYSEIKTNKKLLFLCESNIESVAAVGQNKPARVVISRYDEVHSFAPELIVIADGRHKDGSAEKYFKFGSASQVTMSSLGILGLIKRPHNTAEENRCFTNKSFESYSTDLGPMHLRLLGSYRERYIALGAVDNTTKAALENLSPKEIETILLKVYHDLKDPEEPTIKTFDEVSKSPIHIVLDYRKETIKIFEGSNTIVTVEGDAARKTTFFSGSGLNSAYRGLDKLFTFCSTYANLIFGSESLLHIDEALLEKDQGSLQISMDLLRKGIRFVLTPEHECIITHK